MIPPRTIRRGGIGRRRLRAGFTLVEVVVSTVIVGIVMTAVVSVMLIACRGIGVGAHRAEAVGDATEALQQIILDLGLARTFTERTATAATFTVPDRNGDGQAETIRYAWSGTPGDALTRQCNGGAAVVIARDVHRFNLEYLLKTVTSEEDDEENGEDIAG